MGKNKDRYMIKLRPDLAYGTRKLKGGFIVDIHTETEIPEDLWLRLRERDMDKEAHRLRHRGKPEFIFRVEKAVDKQGGKSK